MKFRFILLSFCSIFMVGCRNEDNSLSNKTPCDLAETVTIREQYPLYLMPMFNPNNPDEVAILRDKSFSSCCDLELLIFNLANRQVRNIYTGPITEIDWGAKDWILFLTNAGGLDRRIYKIRPSGDSLSLFQTDSLLITHISWNKDGDKFIYLSASPSPSSDYYPLTMSDIGGNILKQSFEHTSFDLEWHHEPYMTQAFHYYESSFLINIYNNERLFDDPSNSKITEFNISSFDFGFGRQIDWLDDQTMLVSLSTGLYSVDLSDISNPGEPVLVMANDCPQFAGISNFTVHRATKKVVALFTELEKVEEDVVRYYKILRMNGDGSGVEFFEILE